MKKNLEKIDSAIQALKQGKMVIITDNPDRENEADIIFPAQQTTSEKITFLLNHCSGIICLVITPDLVNKLKLPLMVPEHENTSANKITFTVSIEAKSGITTGISASDRAKTILTAIHSNTTPEDLAKPGHVFPIQAKENGVLERQGHTEGSIDIVKLAGFQPAAVLCELMNPDGTMMRGEKLLSFAEQHQLNIINIEDIIQYRIFYKI